MDYSTIGIVVRDDHNNLLFYENNFFIEASIYKEDDLKNVVKNEIERIIGERTFRLDKVSKKLPKLSVFNNNGIEEELITMYMANIVTYNLNPKFKKEDSILESMPASLYKEYFLKYIIRYPKYHQLVDSYVNILYFCLYLLVILDIPIDISINLPFDGFLITMFLFVITPLAVLYKFIVPSIVKYLINYDIKNIVFKFSDLINWAFIFVWAYILIKR